MPIRRLVLSIFMCLFISNLSFAAPIVTHSWDEWNNTVFPVIDGTNQFSISSNPVLVDSLTNTYEFFFSITNNTITNNGSYSSWIGLSNVVIPAAEGTGLVSFTIPTDVHGQQWDGINWGVGTSTFNQTTLGFSRDYSIQGRGWGSVYPVNTTANMSFTINNTKPGNTELVLFSFWVFDIPNNGLDYIVDPNGGVYQMFSFQIDNGPVSLGAPVATPEPATLILLGAGIGVAAILRRRFIK